MTSHMTSLFRTSRDRAEDDVSQVCTCLIVLLNVAFKRDVFGFSKTSQLIFSVFTRATLC